jgi:ATP-dependent Clp protease ATP-binding subunit ClpA
LAPEIKKVLFGQDEAVEKVSKTVEKALAGLNAPEKPYGAFLFTGPTGTGKTELAKQIAKTMKANFHRLDMSEFKESHSVAKLIGSPAGYVGYDDGSSLTKIINEHPRTVLLLDEIEKAHPDVLKLFLQVMDYGKLTDSKGKEINFKNVLLIMTSNAGVKVRSKSIGISAGSTDNSIDKGEIERLFLPEFRARLTGNGPIEFKPLSKETMEKIVVKNLNEIQKERLDKLNIKLDLDKETIERIAQIGEEKQLGARPVKEFMENEIMEPLTDMVLFGKLKNLKTMTTVKVFTEKGKIKII